MRVEHSATVARIDGPEAGPGTEAPALLSADEVARLLTCSVRTVRRLADAGRMPRPVRLGRLVRWRREGIEQWVRAGCPAGSEGGRHV